MITPLFPWFLLRHKAHKGWGIPSYGPRVLPHGPCSRILPKWAPPYPAPKWQSPNGAQGPLAPCHGSVQAVESVVDIYSVSDSCIICVSSCTGTRACVLAACVGVCTQGANARSTTQGEHPRAAFPPSAGTCAVQADRRLRGWAGSPAGAAGRVPAPGRVPDSIWGRGWLSRVGDAGTAWPGV